MSLVEIRNLLAHRAAKSCAPAIIISGLCASAFCAASSLTSAPAGMKWILGGEFTMGTDDAQSQANEQPAHRVRVDGFYMDINVVTNKDFAKFASTTGYKTTAERKPDWEEIKKQVPPGTEKPDDSLLVPGSLVFTPPSQEVPLDDMSGWWRWTPGANWQAPEGPGSSITGKENFPAVHISWDDANAYAKWAKKRLPTEAEWEFASRGGLQGKRFPWGDDLKPGGHHMANIFQGTFPAKNLAEDGFAGISPVGTFPANGYGLYDMGGNVWNWCSDWYRADTHETGAQQECLVNPIGPSTSLDPNDPYAPKRVIKGGSFLCHESYCESYRPSARRGTPPDTGSSHVGFRCALSGNAPETTATAHAAPPPTASHKM
jgi:formylglycine-generating enzyme